MNANWSRIARRIARKGNRGPAAKAFLLALLFALPVQKSSADLVTWQVDSTASYLRLTVPDQSIALEVWGTATIRIRNADGTAWSDSGGRRAALGGTITTDYHDGSTVKFLDGSHSLYAIEQTLLRPNPADFDPNATDANNPNGRYLDTTTAPAAFGGKVRPTVLLVNLDLAYFALRDVQLDIGSEDIALDGSGSFIGGMSELGFAGAQYDLDFLSASLVGQPFPDLLGGQLGPSMNSNAAGGIIEDLGGLDRRLTYLINTPFAIYLDEVPLIGTLSGVIVANTTLAVVPEAGSLSLMLVGTLGALLGYRIKRPRLQARRGKEVGRPY